VNDPSTEPATRPLSLQDRTVLVSGGASGLGAAVAVAVQVAGGTPVVLDQRAPEASWPFHQVDLADTAATEQAVHTAINEHGGLDAVVTCAGIDLPAPLTDLPAADWERILRVNLLGTVAVVRAALPSLLERQGRVVTVASTLGHGVAGDASAYCASKWGVVGFTRALTAELRGRLGITLLTPGGMATAFFDQRQDQYKPPADLQLCDPLDVAETVVFALTRPPGCEVKELVVTGPNEASWP